MDEHITPHNEIIGVQEIRFLRSCINSPLLNGFTRQDYEDICKVFARVIDRLEMQKNG